MTHFKWTILACLMAGTTVAQDMGTMTAADLLSIAQAEGSVIVYSLPAGSPGWRWPGFWQSLRCRRC